MFSSYFRGANTRPRIRLAAGLIGTALAITALTGCSAASGSLSSIKADAPTATAVVQTAKKPTAPAKPTIVLVHGAWADASSFANVEKTLTKDGYFVLTFANPLRSLTSDSKNLATFLAARTTGPVILVGHSYGGAVISSAGLSDPDVRGLVYVDGFMPEENQSVAEILKDVPSDPTKSFDFLPYEGAQNGDVDLYLKKEVFPLAFANGLKAPAVASLYARQRPIAFSALNEKAIGTPAWKELPSWYVAGTKDNSIPIKLQRSMAKAAGSTIKEFKTGHLTMVQEPTAVAHVIELAAKKTQ